MLCVEGGAGGGGGSGGGEGVEEADGRGPSCQRRVGYLSVQFLALVVCPPIIFQSLSQLYLEHQNP
jgi:hypothetical protein